jgi:hypothetical protein
MSHEREPICADVPLVCGTNVSLWVMLERYAMLGLACIGALHDTHLYGGGGNGRIGHPARRWHDSC